VVFQDTTAFVFGRHVFFVFVVLPLFSSPQDCII
jgi:hypothetical protein